MTLFSMSCPHSHGVWETFQKFAHPISAPNQVRLTMKFQCFGFLRRRIILLVQVVPFYSYKSSFSCTFQYLQSLGIPFILMYIQFMHVSLCLEACQEPLIVCALCTGDHSLPSLASCVTISISNTQSIYGPWNLYVLNFQDSNRLHIQHDHLHQCLIICQILKFITLLLTIQLSVFV